MSTPREGTICPRFSGKLSLVMPTSEDLPLSTPAKDADSAAAKPPAEIGRKEIGRKEIGRKELGGRAGPEPTRFGDWELRGRCIDF